MYKNEVEKPSEPSVGHMEKGMGCKDFKGQADSIAYGQAGEAGCRSDESKIRGQEKHYDWK